MISPRSPIFWLIAVMAIFNYSLHAQSIDYVGSALWSNPQDVVVSGNYAYCAYQAGLVIINTENPSEPTFVGRLFLPGTEGKHLQISGDYIYFADDWQGLEIIDVTDPAAPILASEYEYHSIENIFISGHYAYIVGSTFKIIDISDPFHPDLAGEYYRENASYTSVWVTGNYAYATSWLDTMMIFDVSDPANPQPAGYYGDRQNMFNDVCIRDYYAYIATETIGHDIELLVLDITDPIHPVPVSQYGAGNWGINIVLNQNKAFMTLFGGGFEILNIANPTDPSLWYVYDQTLNGRGIDVRGNYVYLPEPAWGLQIVNVYDEPFLVGRYDSPFWSEDIAVSGDYAYVAAGISGLAILDISHPQDPILVGRDSTITNTTRICVDSAYSYMLSSHHTLVIEDISNQANPRVVGSCTLPAYDPEIFVSGNYLYAVDGELRVVGVANRAAPRVMASFHTPGFAYGVFVAGNYAYVADGYDGGLQRANISDPAHPIAAGGYDTPGCGRAIWVNGQYAYLADDTSGLQIFDISDPDTLMLAGNIRGRYQSVTVSDGKLFLAPSGMVLKVYDLTDPINPVFMTSFDHPYIGRFCVEEDYIYVNRTYSIVILEINSASEINEFDPPLADAVLTNHPNPFNAQTTISYSLSRSGPVTLSIYNIIGQKVAILLDGFQPTGQHQALWDASAFSSGIYFARLESKRQSENIKLILLK
jgi:hypothetical protein